MLAPPTPRAFLNLYELPKMKIVKVILFEVIIIFLAFTSAWIFALVDRVLGLTSFQADWSIIIGGVIILLALILRFWAVYAFYAGKIEFLALKAQGNIVKKAPFNFTRNPMMLSNVLVTLAAVLIFGSVTGFIIPLAIFVISHLWIVFYEEKDLEKKLGEEYIDYKKMVPRWF